MRVLILVSLFLLSCQTSKPLVDKKVKELPYAGRSQPLTTQPETKIDTGTVDAEGKQIDLKVVPVTLGGDNNEPSFSRDGAKLLYISRERPEHSHEQVYELSLNPLRERRVTYHDGDDSSPVYHPDGIRLLYASTTDSLKNDPVFIENLKKMYSSQTASAENKAQTKFDLFVSRLDGRDISRVLPSNIRAQTSQPELSLDPKGRIIAFVAETIDRADIQILPLSGGSIKKLTTGREINSSPKFSLDGTKIAWVKNVPKATQLVMSSVPFSTAIVLSEKIARHLAPAWHPDGEHIAFASDRSGEGNLDLYIYSVKSKCLTRVTHTKADENSPAFSPDGKKLVFVSNVSGRNQIYIAEMKDELVNGRFCLNETL